MGYIVAVAVCLAATPAAECDNITASEFERLWVYRATIEDCRSYAEGWIDRAGLDLRGRYAKVFCVEAEFFRESDWKVVRYGPGLFDDLPDR